MLLLGTDLETTGLSVKEDRIIEIGAVVWDTEEDAPLDLYTSFIRPPDQFLPLSQEVRDVTGIKDEWLVKYGRELSQVMGQMQAFIFNKYEIEYIVAHNGEDYDRPLLFSELDRLGVTEHSFRSIPWLDTKKDIPHEKRPDSNKLKHLALDQGFINPFPHRAFSDVMTMMKVLSRFDIHKVIEESKVPWIVVRAMVSYDDRQLAKDLRYSWEVLGDKSYPKFWVKKIRATQLPQEEAAAADKGFKIGRIE